MKQMRKCPKCGSYTLMETCATCSLSTVIPKPAKFSPEDKYGSYRRKAKFAGLESKGFI